MAAICVLVPTEVVCDGANPLTSVDAMRVTREVHKMEVFMIVLLKQKILCKVLQFLEQL